MNTNEVVELRSKRAKAHADAMTVIAKGNGLTAEDKITYNRAMDEVNRLGTKIQILEGAARNEAPRDYERENSVWNNPQEHLRHAAFMRFVRNGKNNIDAQDRLLLERRDVSEGAPMLNHLGTYTSVGFFVPTGFRNQIEQATKYFCPFLDGGVCTILETATGNPLPMPTSNDTQQAATIVGEAASVSEADVTASQIIFAAYKLSSGEVKASIELLQDSAFDIQEWLSQRFGERYGRGLENYFTNGTGSSQPTGILTAIAASGANSVVAAGSSANDGISGNTGANSIGYNDLVALEHAVDPTYRRNAKYMLHDLTLSSLQKLIDKFGRPLWVPGVAVNVPDTICGYPYVINQSMPQIGSVSEATTMVFGNFSKFIIRRVKDMAVQRLDEKYAEQGQVAFLSFARYDSNLLDAGTHPLVTLQQHS
jgi:HK97 family phage major capsid protein